MSRLEDRLDYVPPFLPYLFLLAVDQMDTDTGRLVLPSDLLERVDRQLAASTLGLRPRPNMPADNMTQQ